MRQIVGAKDESQRIVGNPTLARTIPGPSQVVYKRFVTIIIRNYDPIPSRLPFMTCELKALL